MSSSVQAGATPAPTKESEFGRGAAATRPLLRCGIVVGPFYLAVGLIQAFLRDGFVFSKHPLSVLANGPGGWIQTANFVVSGLMVLATSVGFRRALGPTSRATSWFLGAFGAGMLVAAVFRADPMDGFPVGTPVAPPTSLSTSGLVHFIAGGLGFISLGVSCLLAARAMSRRNERSFARFSVVCGLVVLVGFLSGVAIPSSSPVVGIWIAVVAGWAWLAIVSHHLSRAG